MVERIEVFVKCELKNTWLAQTAPLQAWILKDPFL
jgi:hypothetical protein